MSAKIFFTDYFNVTEKQLENYGSINISVHNDLPLFVDPFLLFGSEKKQYQDLHDEVIKYIVFLKDFVAASSDPISDTRLERYFHFKERKQNWLGFSVSGNQGTGLGPKFAEALSRNLRGQVNDFGNETITQTSHVEKLCLIKDGVGRDHISDLVVNLIMDFLCKYTEKFAKKYIDPSKLKSFMVPRVAFDYSKKLWVSRPFALPTIDKDFVILTPKDLLTQDDTWINKAELLDKFVGIARSMDNSALTSQLNDYLLDQMQNQGSISKQEMQQKASEFISLFPEIIDRYIAKKEETKEEAIEATNLRVKSVEKFFITAIQDLAEKLQRETSFFKQPFTTFEQSLVRVNFLKDVIENKDGHVVFYKEGKRLTAEKDLHVLYRLTWFGTDSDVNREVNNGRGPVDFSISKGKKDKTHIEFKLASNSSLKKNLGNQTAIYARAGNPQKTITVIVYFEKSELSTVTRILKELGKEEDKSIVLINASNDKPSASKATDSGESLSNDP